MEEFIVGIPKTKGKAKENITRYDNMQNAQGATYQAVGIWADDLTKAKELFWVLCINDFKPTKNPCSTKKEPKFSDKPLVLISPMEDRHAFVFQEA